MTKKIFTLGVIGLLSGLSTVFAGDSLTPLPRFDDTRFTCTFEGPAVIGKGAIPLVCTAFGEFERIDLETAKPNFDRDDEDHLTVICGNSVLYSDGVIATFPTNITTELRSVVPGVTTISIRTLNPGSFRGPLGSILRIDIPGTPQALLTGVCHLNRHHYRDGGPTDFSDLEFLE